MRSRSLGWSGALIVLLAWWSAASEAHTRSSSHSFWQSSDAGAVVRMVIPQQELTRLGLHPSHADYRSEAAALLQRGLRLHDAQGPCRAEAALLPELRAGDLIHRWQLHCRGTPSHVELRLFADSDVAHSHVASLQRDADAPDTAVLTRDAHSWHWRADQRADSGNAPEGVSAFFALGVIHILTGWDHLVFLLALIVAARRLREVVILATGFTVGHSLTLALAVLDIARPDSGAVEAFIALSIVLVALDSAVRQDAGARRLAVPLAAALLLLAALSPVMPWLVVAGIVLATISYMGLATRDAAQGAALRLTLTAAFGLFHGFGFAGILNDMALPPESRVLALLGFNLGVETGQLLLLAIAWPLLRAANRVRLPLAPAMTASAAGMGVYWYAMRLFG
ncbi:HupE/UreJ family protein [Algiphilus sp.]|uniref:HupE/UreJ family protein n=1 Tax=Algiphilus sp. TaxID=1872431 RepID=UPI003B51E447